MVNSSRESRLVEVARAYYLENRTQAEIAGSLGISRSQVSRYLAEAREKNIVQIRIVAPGEQSNELSQKLKSRYPDIKEAIVAPAFDDDPESLRAIIGRYAANFLVEVIQPGQILTLGCGRTLRQMVASLPQRDIPEITVVQAMGNLGHEAHHIDYNEIARKAAEALGGRAAYLSAPAILGRDSSSADEFVAANPSLAKALSLARDAEVGIFGLGSMESDLVYTKVGLVQKEELWELDGRVVGDICGRFFNLEGEEQQSAFSERVVGIALEDLQSMSLTVGIAGGADKVAPLLGAVRGRLLDVIISDEQTIRSLLALDDTLHDGAKLEEGN